MSGEFRTEQKINVNLSLQAYSVLVSDMYALFGKENVSGFVNILIQNYAPFSRAAITNRVDAYRDELFSKYGAINRASAEVKKALDRIVSAYRNELVEEMNSYDKGTNFKVRLNNENYDSLLDLEDMGKDLCYFRESMGRYVKAVLEDYSQHTFLERERFFLWDRIQLLENAILSEKLIRIHHVDYASSTAAYYVKPYKVMHGNGMNYWYLVGQCIQPDGEKRNAVYRISRITKIKIESRSGKLTANDKDKLKADIAQKSVQYLVGDSEEIVIQLTTEGLKKYNNILYLRPLYKDLKQIDDDLYEAIFNCTLLQIKHYFLPFGKDAIVVNNKDLFEYFKSFYCDASDAYEHFAPDA